jgi:hypothetical protein
MCQNFDLVAAQQPTNAATSLATHPPRDASSIAAPRIQHMYHYDPATALEELNDDAILPNPVHLRDMLLRAHLDADHSLEYNRLFVDYQRRFGELQKVGRQLLEALGAGKN